MVHRPAGPIMGYCGLHLLTYVWSPRFSRQIFWDPNSGWEPDWSEARGQDPSSGHPSRGPLLPDPSLLRDVEMHRPAPGIIAFILKADVKSYDVHGSAGFWLNNPLSKWRKAFCPFYILYILYTEQSRAGEAVALSPVAPKHTLAVICLSRYCMFRLQNHKFE